MVKITSKLAEALKFGHSINIFRVLLTYMSTYDMATGTKPICRSGNVFFIFNVP